MLLRLVSDSMHGVHHAITGCSSYLSAPADYLQGGACCSVDILACTAGLHIAASGLHTINAGSYR